MMTGVDRQRRPEQVQLRQQITRLRSAWTTAVYELHASVAVVLCGERFRVSKYKQLLHSLYRTRQYCAASDCQTTSGHNSRRSARGRNSEGKDFEKRKGKFNPFTADPVRLYTLSYCSNPPVFDF